MSVFTHETRVPFRIKPRRSYTCGLVEGKWARDVMPKARNQTRCRIW